jgi:hypothetical protein
MKKKYFVLYCIVLLFVACGQTNKKTTNENELSISNNDSSINLLNVDTICDMATERAILEENENNMATDEEFIRIIKNDLPTVKIPFNATDTIGYNNMSNCDNTSLNFINRLSKLSAFPKEFSQMYLFCSYAMNIKGTKLKGFPLFINLFKGAGVDNNVLIFALYDKSGKEINSTILATESYLFLPTSYDTKEEELVRKGWTYTFTNDTIDMVVYSSYNSDYYELGATQDPNAKKERRIFYISDNGKVQLIKKENL